MPKKVVAADVAADGTIYVLGKVGTTTSVTALAGKKKLASYPAVTRAFRVNRVGDSIVTIDSNGRTMRDGAVIDELDRYVYDLVTVRDVTWAPGIEARCAQLPAGALKWEQPGWRIKDGTIKSLCAGKRGPIVVVSKTSFDHTLWEHDGKAWKRRGRITERVNAIAWRPDKDIAYCVGDDIFAVDKAGKVKKLPNPTDDSDRSLWSATWANDTLYAGTLSSVQAIDLATGGIAKEWTFGGEVPNNHSLFSNGTLVVYVCKHTLYVLANDKFTATSVA